MTAAVQTLSPDYSHKDETSARVGMWLFLFTEILLFGGLFLLFSVYRSKFPADFHFAAGTLDNLTAAISTAVLLTASLTMMMAVAHLERNNRKPASVFLGATILLGIAFLFIRWFEWSAKFQQGLYPNSTVLQQHTVGENVFYSLYYLMTGIHALHIVIVLIVSVVMFFLVYYSHADVMLELGGKVENAGLYWHMMNITWIFLFTLLYLVT